MSQNLLMLNRRNFVASLGVFAFGTALGVDIAPRAEFEGKVTGRRLKLAAVGCGGMGGSATADLIKAGCDLVAVCDINPDAFKRWEKDYPGIPKFTDYRDMLKTMGDKFEVVQVGTPDHTHAYISVDCMLALLDRAGERLLHIHVLAGEHAVHGNVGVRVVRTQQKMRVVCQMGNQGHPGVWRYKALRDAAVWGDIKELYSWSDRPIWPQGMKEYAKPKELPANYAKNAWDCWCGPSEDHGYSDAYHAFKWRGWWAYGCGAIGDMAVHNADPAFWALELGLPIKVKADTYGEGPVSIAYPKKSRIEMWFAPNKWVPKGIKMTWYDGRVLPSTDDVPGLLDYAKEQARRREQDKVKDAKKKGKEYTANPDPKPLVPDNGLIIVGSRATTIGGSHAARPSCIAGDKKVFSAAMKPGEERSRYNHYREFVEACLAGDPERCGSKLSYAAPLTEALLIGCVALRFPGEELVFDAKKKRFTNKPEANKWLVAPKRGEWDFKKMMSKRR